MRVLRRAVAAAVASAAICGTTASADDLLILSAFPTEQAVLLSHAQLVTEIGAFNGRRFFRGTIARKRVVLGLTGIGMVNAEATASAHAGVHRRCPRQDRPAGLLRRPREQRRSLRRPGCAVPLGSRELGRLRGLWGAAEHLARHRAVRLRRRAVRRSVLLDRSLP